MSWAFPVNLFVDGQVLAVDEINENLSIVANELDGHLNEHNWSVSALANLMVVNKTVANDIVARLISLKIPRDPFGAFVTMYQVPHATGWSPIIDTEITFLSQGGLVLLICSFQMHCPSTPAAQSGLNFALEVDGSVRASSLLGTGDQSNDYVDTAVTAATGAIALSFGTSPSFRADQEPKMVKALVRVAPGEHSARLVARDLFTIDTPPAQFISQAEIVALHLWA
jgi:hypothetical protein